MNEVTHRDQSREGGPRIVPASDTSGLSSLVSSAGAAAASAPAGSPITTVVVAASEPLPVDPTPLAGLRIVRRRRWLRRTVKVVALLVVAGVVYFGVTLYQVQSTGSSDQARPVDAIVVMGAAQYDGTPSPQLRARLDHVVELWQRRLAPMVVVTGGKQQGDRFTEAEASSSYLVEHGIPPDAILAENDAHNSYDSLRGVRDLLAARGLHRVLLVSDPYHSLRIRLVSQELGMTAYVSPTRTSPVTGSKAFGRKVEEAAGISVGRIIGFRRLLSITG